MIYLAPSYILFSLTDLLQDIQMSFFDSKLYRCIPSSYNGLLSTFYLANSNLSFKSLMFYLFHSVTHYVTGMQHLRYTYYTNKQFIASSGSKLLLMFISLWLSPDFSKTLFKYLRISSVVLRIMITKKA